MADVIAFDSHRFVENLTANGFTEAQAEVLAQEQIHLLDSNLATKADVLSVKSELAARTEQVKSELGLKIAQVGAEVRRARADVFRLMLSVAVAQTALLAALIWYV